MYAFLSPLSYFYLFSHFTSESPLIYAFIVLRFISSFRYICFNFSIIYRYIFILIMSAAFVPRHTLRFDVDILIHPRQLGFVRSAESTVLENIARNVPPREWVRPLFVQGCRLFEEYTRLHHFLSSETFDYFVISAATATGKTSVVSSTPLFN